MQSPRKSGYPQVVYTAVTNIKRWAGVYKKDIRNGMEFEIIALHLEFRPIRARYEITGRSVSISRLNENSFRISIN